MERGGRVGGVESREVGCLSGAEKNITTIEKNKKKQRTIPPRLLAETKRLGPLGVHTMYQ